MDPEATLHALLDEHGYEVTLAAFVRLAEQHEEAAPTGGAANAFRYVKRELKQAALFSRMADDGLEQIDNGGLPPR
jgi:hypothetical protein